MCYKTYWLHLQLVKHDLGKPLKCKQDSVQQRSKFSTTAWPELDPDTTRLNALERGLGCIYRVLNRCGYVCYRYLYMHITNILRQTNFISAFEDYKGAVVENCPVYNFRCGSLK